MNENQVTTRVAVRDSALDVAALSGEIQDDRAGATVVFSGMVRNHSPGKAGVTSLEYEAYTEQVESKIAEIVAEASNRWGVLHIVVEHRIGIVEVGQPTVVVAVSSAHRGDAFEAARYLIDELKVRAPIWKKEHWPGGAEWVEGA